MSNRLLRAPSFTVLCETGEGSETGPAFSLGDAGLPLREVSLFHRGGASMHKLRMSYGDCRFEAQGQLALWSCHTAHLQSVGQSIMFTSVDLHTVQEYHDKVHEQSAETDWVPGVRGIQHRATRPCQFSRAHLRLKAWCGVVRGRSPKTLLLRRRRMP